MMLNRFEAMRMRQFDQMLKRPSHYGIDHQVAEKTDEAIANLQKVIQHMVDQMRQISAENVAGTANVSGEYLRLASLSALCDETILRAIIGRIKAAKTSGDELSQSLSKIEWAMEHHHEIAKIAIKAQAHCDKLAARCILAAVPTQKEQGVTMGAESRPMVLLPGGAS